LAVIKRDANKTKTRRRTRIRRNTLIARNGNHNLWTFRLIRRNSAFGLHKQKWIPRNLLLHGASIESLTEAPDLHCKRRDYITWFCYRANCILRSRTTPHENLVLSHRRPPSNHPKNYGRKTDENK
jgi:hypothetical protein